MNIGCDNKLIANVSNAKFLGIAIDNTVFSKIHIEQTGPKLSAACHVVTYVKPYMSQRTCKTVYYSYFHFSINYGLIFWGTSSYSVNIFKIQKNIQATLVLRDFFCTFSP